MTRFTTRAFTLVLTLLLGAVQAQAADLLASVDRSRVNSGETVELTLESNDVTLFGKPDLAPLQAQFEVQGTRQVNQLTSLNGDNRAITRWIVTLLPRTTGSVVIPPLQLGEAQSQPITLQVLQSASRDDSAPLEPVFIDASLDQDSVYVQAQAVLTLHIYHSVSLYDDSSLTPLQIGDARVEQLGESRTYEKVINGVRHGVIEVRYAIFPQHSGVLDIPPLTFSATLADAAPQSPAPLGLKPGKLMHVSSAQMPLTVKAKPAEYPADAPWLPARSLSLGESWNPEPDHSQVGDSLTRSLTLKAEGLSSSQLPPLPLTEANGLRSYPDQPQLSNQIGDRGLIGSREDSQALVPNRSGSIELPAVEVVWWNTHEDHLERSSLPARTLQVANNPSLVVDTPAGAAPTGLGSEDGTLWAWKLSTLVLACTTLLGFGLWWRARWQPAILRTVQAGPSPRTLLDDLKRACLANDPQATRQALDAWARQQPETLADMAARFVPLSDALDGLNGALYSETGQYWQGEELWRAIRTIPITERVQDPVADTSSLPPLYPK
ncbi:BatD family protein [Pseudomonas chlororaphis]|uniref:BatD family protein n=1 Tax=Pseudomonas chlororaphis TaxID=587753 RepID=UPI001E3A5499|nr:BatD family protein [Pseudomonas chlororaphis]MCB2250322.1 BatD family protein [Pseudomonas chlororaphis]